MDDVAQTLAALARTEKRVVMTTLVATKGTTPKKEGAKMFVGEGGRVLGSVTIGGCVDARVIAESEQVLAQAQPRLLSMALGDEDAWELGFSCGGTVELLLEPLSLSPAHELVEQYQKIAAELSAGRGAVLVRPLADLPRSRLVLESDAAEPQALALLDKGTSRTEPLGGAGPAAFFEVHAPLPELILVGAGHVSQAIVPQAKLLGYRVTVVDPRPRFASRERFPQADAIEIGITSEIVARLPVTARTAVVITIHDYKVEVPVLRALAGKGIGYIGMLGNRRRGKAVLDALREAGVPEEQVARIQVPVGLDIGAQSTAEIALSVLAQIVAWRSNKSGASLQERAP